MVPSVHFTDTDEAISGPVPDDIGIAKGFIVRGEGLRCGLWLLAIQTLILGIAKINRICRDSIGSTTVFVDARSHIKRRGRQILALAIRSALN
jgi:hypothetical protein